MYLAFGCFALAVLAEALLAWRAGKPLYELRETELSLGLMAGWVAVTFAAPGLGLGPSHILRLHPLVTLPRGWLGVAVLLICGDFTLYWLHRGSHAFRWQWASHQAHHSARRLNVLAAFRQGWTDLPAGLWLYWLPFAFVDFEPWQWAVFYFVTFGSNICVHNEWAPRLGPLEAILVTPSSHRVHHALERGPDAGNFGVVLIVWDRLFGTFQAEGDVRVTQFGVADRAYSGVLDIAFGEWRTMAGEIYGRLRRRLTGIPAAPGAS